MNKNMDKYEVQEIINSIVDSDRVELSENAEIMTDEIIKYAKRLKLAQNVGKISAAGLTLGIVFTFAGQSFVGKIVGSGLIALSSMGLILSNKIYKFYSKELKALGFVTNSILKELLFRLKTDEQSKVEKELLIQSHLNHEKNKLNAVDIQPYYYNDL